VKLKGKMAYTPWESTQGVNNRSARLTEDDVRIIRASEKSANQIGQQFGISAGHVSAIKNRKKWKHVK